MNSSEEKLALLLRQAGQSVTAPRIGVFRALLGQEPLSMRELVARTKKIDRASVYRTVALFEKLGIAQRLYVGWKYKIELSDSFNEHHHHLTCLRCGRTISMNEAALERFIEQLARTHGFKPTAHQIEIQGLCAACQRLTSQL